MKLLIKHKLLILILLIGLFLRFNDYPNNPPRGASSDEYTYTFMGVSLLRKGVPTSWSNFASYQHYGAKKLDRTIHGIFFPLVTPYFDHPPLNGILTGGWAILNGQANFASIKIETIRQVPIFLGLISSILLYVIALRIYGKKTAIWALLIYSTATLFVMESRVVFAENLLTPLFLGSILLLDLFKKKINIKLALLLGLIAGLSFWTKELGVVVFLATLTMFLLEKVKRKTILLFCVISISIFLLYPLYGYFYNWDLFVSVIATQSLRQLGPNTLYTLFFHPIVVNELYYDGWYLLGFVSFLASFLEFEKHKRILIPAFLYFFLLMFSLTREGEMGWYMLPMFPFFSILTANLLVENIKKHGWYIFVATLFVGMYITQYRIEAKYGLSNPTFRIILLVLFVPLFVSYFMNKPKLYRLLSNVWFYGLIFGSALVTWRYIHPL